MHSLIWCERRPWGLSQARAAEPAAGMTNRRDGAGHSSILTATGVHGGPQAAGAGEARTRPLGPLPHPQTQARACSGLSPGAWLGLLHSPGARTPSSLVEPKLSHRSSVSPPLGRVLEFSGGHMTCDRRSAAGKRPAAISEDGHQGTHQRAACLVSLCFHKRHLTAIE